MGTFAPNNLGSSRSETGKRAGGPGDREENPNVSDFLRDGVLFELKRPWKNIGPGDSSASLTDYSRESD
jgi:hypothetical protein